MWPAGRPALVTLASAPAAAANAVEKPAAPLWIKVAQRHTPQKQAAGSAKAQASLKRPAAPALAARTPQKPRTPNARVDADVLVLTAILSGSPYRVPDQASDD
jgi:hypothetical protein